MSKMILIVRAGALAAAAFTLSAGAAPDEPARPSAKVEQAAPTESAKPCNCMDEKAVDQAARDAKPAERDDKTASAKVNPMFDRSKHFHPRDGGKL